MNHPRKPIPRRGGTKARVREHMRVTGGTYQQALQSLRDDPTTPAPDEPRLYLGRELDPVTFEATGPDCWWPLSEHDPCMYIAGDGADLRHLAYAWQLHEQGCAVLVITDRGDAWKPLWGDGERVELCELRNDDDARDAVELIRAFRDLDPVWGSVGGVAVVDLSNTDLWARAEESWQWNQLLLRIELWPQRAAADGAVVLASVPGRRFNYFDYPARMSADVRTGRDGWLQVSKRRHWMKLFPSWEGCLERDGDARFAASHPVWDGMNPVDGRVVLVNLPGEPTRLILGTDPPLPPQSESRWTKSWHAAAGAMPVGVPDAAAVDPDPWRAVAAGNDAP